MLKIILGEIEFCLAKFEFLSNFFRISFRTLGLILLLPCVCCVLEASSAIIHSWLPHGHFCWP